MSRRSGLLPAEAGTGVTLHAFPAPGYTASPRAWGIKGAFQGDAQVQWQAAIGQTFTEHLLSAMRLAGVEPTRDTL